jgi:hypothetical protein
MNSTTLLLCSARQRAFPKKGPISQPNSVAANVAMPMEMNGSVGMVLATTSATAGEIEMAVPQPAKAAREVRTEVERE